MKRSAERATITGEAILVGLQGVMAKARAEKVEIVAAVKNELGLNELETVFKAVDPQTRIPQLVDGTIDIECGSTTNTLTRQKQVDFTHITYVTGAKLLAKSESDIADFGDLDGKTIALSDITCPVLQFHGLQDTAVDKDGLRDTWNWITEDYTLVTVPSAGHFVQWDAAELVSETMKWWLLARQ